MAGSVAGPVRVPTAGRSSATAGRSAATAGRSSATAGRSAATAGRRGSAARGGATLALPAPRTAPLPRTAYDLMADAGRALGRAIRAQAPAERFAAAHLAALRGAAAVLAARARPRRSARGNAWDLLPRVAPDLAEWATFFAAGSATRQAAQAGLSVRLSAREADDMVRQAAAFLDLVEQALVAA